MAEEVYTSLGGLLFAKGTALYEKEMEILEAFLITQVDIEGDEAEGPAQAEQQIAATSQSTVHQIEKPAFQDSYDKAVTALKKIIRQIEGGSNLPVMEVREVISPLLEQFQENPQMLLSLRGNARVDSYSYEHALAVGILSHTIAKWMKVPEREWMQVALAGTLLDVGKAKIDRRILQKPGKLSTEEFEEMKRHTVYGYQIIRASHGLSEGVALAVLQHHEREDGSGYPLGLPGSKLHLYSKITAVADVYHAMCSDRVYQKAKSPYVVAEQLMQDSFGKLDPQVVHTFIKGITQFAVGTVVELSDGRLGKIVFTDNKNPTRPMIETGGTIVNLAESRQLSIVKVVEQ